MNDVGGAVKDHVHIFPLGDLSPRPHLAYFRETFHMRVNRAHVEILSAHGMVCSTCGTPLSDLKYSEERKITCCRAHEEKLMIGFL